MSVKAPLSKMRSTRLRRSSSRCWAWACIGMMASAKVEIRKSGASQWNGREVFIVLPLTAKAAAVIPFWRRLLCCDAISHRGRSRARNLRHVLVHPVVYSLALIDQLSTPVLRPGFFVAAIHRRLFFAVANALNLLRQRALENQYPLHGFSATLAQSQVVLLRKIGRASCRGRRERGGT